MQTQMLFSSVPFCTQHKALALAPATWEPCCILFPLSLWAVSSSFARHQLRTRQWLVAGCNWDDVPRSDVIIPQAVTCLCREETRLTSDFSSSSSDNGATSPVEMLERPNAHTLASRSSTERWDSKSYWPWIQKSCYQLGTVVQILGLIQQLLYL